ncbi:hypothetical protein GQ607_000140 [Colletotrichum asianum]|uniref:Uncharacterized protein n=1 Tax=Colletotrichum asianum TaxID=702518 RepID=A0A8H3ZTM0_9PEZI|nr:hypothetical protein GQ607_000140 [Colletotrichum asianum]
MLRANEDKPVTLTASISNIDGSQAGNLGLWNGIGSETRAQHSPSGQGATQSDAFPPYHDSLHCHSYYLSYIHDNDMPTHITRQQDNEFTLARACQVVILDLSWSGSGPAVVCLILCLGPRWPPASQHQVRRLHMPRFQHRHPQHVHLQQIQSGGASLGWLAAVSIHSIPASQSPDFLVPSLQSPNPQLHSLNPSSHPILSSPKGNRLCSH